ncbi:MAG: multicopper oxidase domain-containing protein [Pseudomonadota bacterium]
MTRLTRRQVVAGTTALAVMGPAAPILTTAAQAQDNPKALVVEGSDGAFTYNGTSPGPTLTMEPGGTLDIELVNELPALHDDCVEDVNQFHGRHTTNLHTHGFHVSPTTDASGTYDADNVFVSVTPKDQFVPCDEICGASVADSFRTYRTQYRFEIGAGHPSGTFWYHAHKHGATQAQVAGGLFGPLIVRDAPGAMPAYIAAAPERVLMIVNDGVILVAPEGGGVKNPTLTLRPGEVQRWRIINAQASGIGGGSFARISTNVPELELYQIAFDGLTLPQRVNIDQYDREAPWLNPAAMAPGNRMDVMVRVPIDARPRSFAMDVAARVADRLDFGSVTERIMLKVEIAGEPLEAMWSDDPALPAAPLADFDDTPLPKRRITFQGGFRIDGEQYSGAPRHVVTLGTSEEWTVENNTAAVHAHHIHVNPFLVTHINGRELAPTDPLRRWQDTIALPFSTNDGPGTITYKTRFETFTGKFVLHCHILRHEDRGMMQTVEVV